MHSHGDMCLSGSGVRKLPEGVGVGVTGTRRSCHAVVTVGGLGVGVAEGVLVLVTGWVPGTVGVGVGLLQVCLCDF